MNAATAFTIAIPTLAVMFGILLNRQDSTAIRAELRTEIRPLRTETNQLRSELRGQMVQLRTSIHGDMVVCMNAWPS